VKNVNGESLMLGPRSKGLAFTKEMKNVNTVSVNQTVQLEEWQTIKNADVLMLPIGGREAHNTMDETEALRAIKDLKPKIVIPCHYNLPALFTKKYCKADEAMFKIQAEKSGSDCRIMKYGDEIKV